MAYNGVHVHALGIYFQVFQAEEQKGEAEYEFANILPVALAGENQRHAHGKQGDGKGSNVYLKTNCGYNPCRNSGTNVGAHYDTDSLGKGHKSCINETYDHNCGGR